MTRLLAVLVAAALALTGCGYTSTPSPPPVAPADGQDPSSGFLAGVVSACDEHGNRVYARPASGTIAVLGQDPTCPPATSGTSNSGLEQGVAPVDLEGAVAG